MTDFPRGPEQLSAEWLSIITGSTVGEFHVSPLGEGLGVIGQVTRVMLENTEGPRSLVVKFASAAPENRAVAATYDMYQREVHFYRELAGRVPIRTPRCYAAHYDAASAEFVVALEDLSQCRVGDQIAGADLNDAQAVITRLAALHAATWDQAIDGVNSHDLPAQREGIAAGFLAGWPVVLERLGHLLPEPVRSVAPALADEIGPLIASLTQPPQCLVHADVRLDNVLFDGSDVILVDWQSVCTSSGEQDLAYFVTQSVEDSIRAARLDELIALYHRSLTAAGVTDHPLAACRARFVDAALYLFAWAVLIAGTLDMGNDRGRRLAETLLRRSVDSVVALNGFARLG